MAYYLQSPCFQDDIEEVKKYIFTKIEHKHKSKLIEIIFNLEPVIICKIKEILDKEDRRYQYMSEIISLLCKVCDIKIFLDNSDFWREILQTLLCGDCHFFVIRRKVFNILLQRKDLEDFLKNERVLEILMNYEMTDSLTYEEIKHIIKDNILIQITGSLYDPYNKNIYLEKEHCIIINCLLRIMEKKYGKDKMLNYFCEEIFIKAIYGFYGGLSVPIKELYFVILNALPLPKENYKKTITEYFTKTITKYFTKSVYINDILKQLELQFIPMLNPEYALIVPYILFIIQELKIKFSDEFIKKVTDEKFNRRELVLAAMTIDYYNDIFYTNMNNDDKEYFVELHKKQKKTLEPLKPFLIQYILEPLVYITIDYIGIIDEKYVIL